MDTISSLLILFSLCLAPLCAVEFLRGQELRRQLDEKERLLKRYADLRDRTFNTGLKMKEPFLRDAATRMGGPSAPGGAGAFVVLDGDRFSALHGQAGPAAISSLKKKIADLMRERFPENGQNLLGNVGPRSDEFLLLLTGRDSPGALREELEALRRAVADARCNGARATVTLGALLLPSEPVEVTEAYKAACALLRLGKAGGGNRVILRPFVDRKD